MPSSMSNHRSMAPAPSQARTGSVSRTGSSSSARPATVARRVAAVSAMARTLGSQRAKPRSGDQRARRPATASDSMASSYDARSPDDTAVPGSEKRSRSSGPAVTSRWRALSATVVARAPWTAVSDPVGLGFGMRPWLGLNPTKPQNAAGMRVDPPPSLAVATGTRPAATAAALPPPDPPGVGSGFHGLRANPNTLVFVKLSVPNSGAAVLPTGTAPAARRRATWIESAATGPRPA